MADILAGLGLANAETFCRQLGLVGLVAEREGDLAAFAVAESHPRVLHVANLEGEPDASRLLLVRLMRLAGERDVSVCCSVERQDLQEVIEEMGFAQQHQDRHSCYYLWRQNVD